MKRWTMLLSCLIVLGTVSGCRVVVGDTPFVAGFSLGSVIEANQHFLLDGHTALSGTLSGPQGPLYQRTEEAIVHIDAAQIPAFMEAVQADVEQALVDAGARIYGRESNQHGQEEAPRDSSSFAFRYSDGQADGMVNVWGVRGPETSLVLIVLTTESRGD